MEENEIEYVEAEVISSMPANRTPVQLLTQGLHELSNEIREQRIDNNEGRKVGRSSLIILIHFRERCRSFNQRREGRG